MLKASNNTPTHSHSHTHTHTYTYTHTHIRWGSILTPFCSGKDSQVSRHVTDPFTERRFGSVSLTFPFSSPRFTPSLLPLPLTPLPPVLSSMLLCSVVFFH